MLKLCCFYRSYRSFVVHCIRKRSKRLKNRLFNNVGSVLILPRHNVVENGIADKVNEHKNFYTSWNIFINIIFFFYLENETSKY